MKKKFLWLGVMTLVLTGGVLAYSNARQVVRAHAEGRCICPLTGREISPDHCPFGGLFQHGCSAEKNCHPDCPTSKPADSGERAQQ